MARPSVPQQVAADPFSPVTDLGGGGGGGGGGWGVRIRNLKKLLIAIADRLLQYIFFAKKCNMYRLHTEGEVCNILVL